MSEMLEVRCCCTPDKLLGWIPGISDGRYVKISNGNPLENLTLMIHILADGKGGEYRAIKAEGFTKEQLMNYPAFRPAP